MEGDGQAQKRAAAEAYAFEEDSRWSDYWNNVLIPPHMSSRPEVRRHFQLKFYQRFVVCATSDRASLFFSRNNHFVISCSEHQAFGIEVSSRIFVRH
jgi:hypothetical protein